MRTHVVILLLCLIPLFACSTLERGTDSKATPASDASQRRSGAREKNPTKARSPIEGAQVTWESPSEPVDGFVIRYGETPQKLEKELRVATSELHQEDDPEYGPVYRYVIRNVPKSSNLYVAVAAFKGERISDFSSAVRTSVGSAR